MNEHSIVKKNNFKERKRDVNLYSKFFVLSIKYSIFANNCVLYKKKKKNRSLIFLLGNQNQEKVWDWKMLMPNHFASNRPKPFQPRIQLSPESCWDDLIDPRFSCCPFVQILMLNSLLYVCSSFVFSFGWAAVVMAVKGVERLPIKLMSLVRFLMSHLQLISTFLRCRLFFHSFSLSIPHFSW